MSNQNQSHSPLPYNLQGSSQSHDTATLHSANPNTTFSCYSKTGQSQNYSSSTQFINKPKTNIPGSKFSKKDCIFQQKINIIKNGKLAKGVYKTNDRFKAISNLCQTQCLDEKILSNSMDNLHQKKSQLFQVCQQKVDQKSFNSLNYNKNMIQIGEAFELDSKSSCKTTASKLIESGQLDQPSFTRQNQKLCIYQSFEAHDQMKNIEEHADELKEQDDKSDSQLVQNEQFFSYQEVQKMQIDGFKYQTIQIKNNMNSYNDTQKQDEVKRLREALRQTVDQNQILKDRIMVLESVLGQLASGSICDIRKSQAKNQSNSKIDKFHSGKGLIRKYSE